MLLEDYLVLFKGESPQELKDTNRHNPTIGAIEDDLLIYLYHILIVNV
jgi:hypothetical protein